MFGSPAPALPQAGELYGKYQLVEKIATGGMAEIFRAVSTSISGFKKEVAVKRILPHLSCDAEFVSLFIDEAKLTVSLSHGNIVQVFDFGRIDSNYYLAMEYVAGRDLTDVLIKQSRRQHGVPVPIALFIIKEILRGLEYAHTRRGSDGVALGIVHRDVSPHNVLLSYDGEVKLTDFGIAKARTRVSLTRPGVVVGKFAYMSPEQARGREVDARSDVYSAGITLYETLTGRRLFHSDDPARVLAKVRDPNVAPPSKYAPSLSGRIDHLVMTALAASPSERFPSCRAFGTAVERELALIAPELSDAHVSRFMKDLFEDEVGASTFAMAAAPEEASQAERPTIRLDPDAELPLATIPEKPADTRPLDASGRKSDRPRGASTDRLRVVALRERLRTAPDLWTLAALGEALLTEGRAEDGFRALRAAGLKFAQHGHLVQAVAQLVRAKSARPWSAERALEAASIRGLPGESNAELLRRLGDPGRDDLGQLITDLLTQEEPVPAAEKLESPLLSLLDAAEFANLVGLLELRRAAPGSVIMEEGDPGKSMYIIARGRVLIYCRNFHGAKVYLSSLSDGECFGEFSFFTQEPRAATVEALDEVLLFEIKPSFFDEIPERFPKLTETLLAFYKGRVATTLLAKSEVFGGLGATERSWVLDRLEPERRAAGEVIVSEGDDSDGFYLIKAGEVEVFSDRRGYVFLDKLKAGEFFGEIAALTGAPRTASVRALGPCELLRLDGKDLQALLASSPGVKDIVRQHIARREAETAQRVTAGGALI